MDKKTLNSQAIILLTAYFNKGDKPLTVTEYSNFAQWLISQQKTPEDLLSDRREEIVSTYKDKKVTKERLCTLLDRGNAMAITMQKWQNAGIWVITRADKEYPQKLKQDLKHKAPPILYGAGEKKILRTKGIAIIGSRNVSEDDLKFTFALGKKLAYSGYSVVSGGARGVDEASMMGSINAGGTTIGVVADSLMQKVLSRKYRDALIQGNLVLISPYYPEARFNVGNAMGRNKYIYTLAYTSIVIHSGLSGGTWEGAKENLKYGWVPLFVKNSHDVESGNIRLLEMGGEPLSETVLQDENIEYLFEVKKKIDSINTIKSDDDTAQSIEERILELLSKERLSIKAVTEKLQADEKSVKKIIEKMLKHGALQKHNNRPLQFSKVMKLPSFD